MSKKQRALRVVRNVTITSVVLLVVMVGAGVGYVWYSGQQEVPKAAVVAPATTVTAPKISPPKPTANTPVSASIRMMNSSVAPGENTSITVNTLPEAMCTIVASYNGVQSTDSGLSSKKADEYGNVTWAWTVEADVPVGTWPVDVTCLANNKSAVVRGDLVVKTN